MHYLELTTSELTTLFYALSIAEIKVQDNLKDIQSYNNQSLFKEHIQYFQDKQNAFNEIRHKLINSK